MIPKLRLAVHAACLAAVAAATLCAQAADIANSTPTAIKEPDCIADPTTLFFWENFKPVVASHPVLPIGQYYTIVRYMGDAASTPVQTDFGFMPQDYPYPPFRGLPLTGYTPPAPRSLYQRSSFADATPDTASAFQMHCYDAGSYINTFSFPKTDVSGGGPHSVYGYSFDASNLPPAFDNNPGTDYAIQAAIEIPWFYSVNDPDSAPDDVPVGQVVLFTYFRDRISGRTFAHLLAVFDSRATAPGATYTPFVGHDGFTPFVSTPLNANSKYATLSPYSWTYTGNTWAGLRFFRAHVTQVDFGQAIADINAYCAANPTLQNCVPGPNGGPPFSTSVTDYAITDFGELHEVFLPAPKANLSMGVHVFGLGIWNMR